MIGNVGTAVVMFPILKRYSEILSLSYVASRMIEATIIGRMSGSSWNFDGDRSGLSVRR